MFYWTKYRLHGNIPGNKPALNNGSDLFSKNPVLRFFRSFVSRKLRKILPYWHWSGEILTERSSVILCLRFNVFWSCPLSDFSFCVQASYACSELLFYQIYWNSNERFHRNQCISIFWLTGHALHLTRSRSFSIHTNSPRKAGSNSITFKYIEKQTFFTHNRLFDC